MVDLRGNPVAQIETSSADTHVGPIDSSPVGKNMRISAFGPELTVSLSGGQQDSVSIKGEEAGQKIDVQYLCKVFTGCIDSRKVSGM